MRLVRCLAVLFAVVLSGSTGVANELTLFGSQEVFSPDNSAFFKWTGVLARFAAERRRAGRCSDPAADAQDCQWQALVASVTGLEPRAMIERVNATINRHPYVPSQRNWGESNYWETPFEFLRKSG